MSADNWARCPRCVESDHQRLLDMQAKVNASYGDVPVEEFDRLRDELIQKTSEHGDYNNFRTFREDYEITGAEEGEVTVSYSGRCAVCGLSENFEHVHPLAVTQ